MDWDNIYRELTNKIRWAISTTVNDNGLTSMGFREAMELAKLASGDTLPVLKERERSVDTLSDMPRKIRRAMEASANGSAKPSAGSDN